jgi:hypothetical protein
MIAALPLKGGGENVLSVTIHRHCERSEAIQH